MTEHPISQYMSKSPVTIGRHASLARAHAVMRERDIRHLPVVQGNRVVGVVSRGDLHLLETIADFPLESVEVEEAMTSDPYLVSGDTALDDVVETMRKHKYGSAVIVDVNGNVEGIFTTVDAMDVLVKQLRVVH